jgi:excisionase family DNA binding protein
LAGRRGTATERAFTTGQAARLCFVTPETILNWIRGSRLKAYRTAGGQFRILRSDLRRFMVEEGMAAELVDREAGLRPYCWEFHGEEDARYGCALGERCGECLVKRSETLNCWQLHGLVPLTVRRVDHCEDCAYYRKYGERGPGGAADPSSKDGAES